MYTHIKSVGAWCVPLFIRTQNVMIVKDVYKYIQLVTHIRSNSNLVACGKPNISSTPYIVMLP